jgi:hypothetical protein
MAFYRQHGPDTGPTYHLNMSGAWGGLPTNRSHGSHHERDRRSGVFGGTIR